MPMPNSRHLDSFDVLDFRFRKPVPFRWADLDSMGHTNNAIYLTYFEQIRILYARDVMKEYAVADLSTMTAKIYAIARSTLVGFDYRTQKSAIIPMAYCEAAQQFEPRPIEGLG